ncbi:MAG: hypothetical protein ACREMG_06740, partial [Gemmatimonadales bacterium]
TFRPALDKARHDPRAVARTPGFAAGVGALAGVVFAELIGSTPLAILLAMGALGLAWVELGPSLCAALGVARRASGFGGLIGRAEPDVEIDLADDAERRRVAAAVASGATGAPVASIVEVDAQVGGSPPAPTPEVAGGTCPSPGVVAPERRSPQIGWLAGKGANGLAVMAGSLGMLRGATGIGGAAVLLPWAGRHLGLSRRAVAEGLLTAVLVGSATAGVLHMLAGNIAWMGLVLLLAGGGLGSLASACVLRPVSEAIRSRVLGGILAGCAVLLLLRAV